MTSEKDGTDLLPTEGFWPRCAECGGYHLDENVGFQSLARQACNAVQATTQPIYQEFRISEPGGKYYYDGDTGLMTFTTADGARCHSRFQRVGTWVRANHSFMWSWAQDQGHGQEQASIVARTHGDEHDYRVLTSPMLLVSEADAWHLCDIIAHLSGMPMTYRAPVSDRTYAYFALERPVWET